MLTWVVFIIERAEEVTFRPDVCNCERRIDGAGFEEPDVKLIAGYAVVCASFEVKVERLPRSDVLPWCRRGDGRVLCEDGRGESNEEGE